MAKEFDIYLRERLVECDLLVYSITYHDGISVTNRLILEAALNNYILQKFAATQMGSELTAHIDQMIKLCKEKLAMTTVLDATAKMEARASLSLDDAPLILDVSTVETLERVMNEAENKLVIAVDPLVVQAASSTGPGSFPTVINQKVAGTLKNSLLTLRSALNPVTEVDQVNQIDYIDVDAPVVSEATLSSLCYKLTFDASAAMEIVAMVLGTEIHHSLGTWYNGLRLGSKVTGSWMQKFEIVQTVLTILQEANAMLIDIIYPSDGMAILKVDDLSADTKRYRLLQELDDSELGDLDDMTLEELDYVWLT